ncbi:hypothetical protein L1987_02207 [Smallanthus sonchifolius]|uniref:Uncharacterized protein n=1 Tax=Smallanthus sonchifolius TaxID=185202 RepID=A0ACB9K7D1_9ASTR|nr:hypothetical protein L1987_02207 [Smallanthus sonchifolius]
MKLDLRFLRIPTEHELRGHVTLLVVSFSELSTVFVFILQSLVLIHDSQSVTSSFASDPVFIHGLLDLRSQTLCLSNEKSEARITDAPAYLNKFTLLNILRSAVTYNGSKEFRVEMTRSVVIDLLIV